jgi:hypothetical protein
MPGSKNIEILICIISSRQVAFTKYADISKLKNSCFGEKSASYIIYFTYETYSSIDNSLCETHLWVITGVV